MRRYLRTCVIVLAATVALAWAAPGRARAQALEVARARQGYYVAFGAGPEVEAASNKGDGLTLSGGAGALRLGQMLSPRFGLGIRIDSGSAKDDRWQGSAGGLSLEGQLNLWRDLSLHAGIGLGFTSLTDTKSPDSKLTGGYGALASLAVSYDWFFTDRLSGGWAVTPMLALRTLPGGGDVEASWIGLAVQVTWWSGRPRQELLLDEKAAYGR